MAQSMAAREEQKYEYHSDIFDKYRYDYVRHFFALDHMTKISCENLVLSMSAALSLPVAGMTTDKADGADQPFLHVRRMPVYFSEDWRTGIGGGLWSTGRMMAQFFASDHARRLIQDLSHDRGLRVLELGSGNGLLSVCFMALAKDCVSQLVVTDLDDHLELIRQTIAANPLIIDSSDSSKVLVMEHEWGRFVARNDDTSREAQVQQAKCTFDCIIGSDVAYHPSLYKPLIASLQAYFNNKTVALLGFTMLDTSTEFFDMLRQAGFSYERIPDALIESKEFRGSTFGLFFVRRQKPRLLIQYR